ncbi:MAG: UDP-glucuronate 4-epimerase, partial [Thermoplasmata archaeon]|nr:UDP-glucuronate 4-epimerase [Thermoplasmata archaeon]
FNLGAGHPVVLSRFIAMVEAAVGRKAVVRHELANPGDAAHTWADTTKARNRLSWEPKVSFEEELRKTVEWHRSRAAAA